LIHSILLANWGKAPKLNRSLHGAGEGGGKNSGAKCFLSK